MPVGLDYANHLVTSVFSNFSIFLSVFCGTFFARFATGYSKFGDFSGGKEFLEKKKYSKLEYILLSCMD